MDPILLNIPVPIKTPRLLLRPLQPSDGKELNVAILESFEQLHQWMEWAVSKPTMENTEIFCRQSEADWILRKNLNLLIVDSTGTIIGSTGYNFIKWEVPSLRIGYWIRTSMAGQGYVTEAVNALVRYAFSELKMVRIEIRCDEDNVKSWRVAERLNFVKEANLKASARKNDGNLRNTIIYARHDALNLPELDVSW